MELDEFDVAEDGADASGNGQAIADRFGGVRRELIDAPNAAASQDDGLCLDDDRIAAAVDSPIEPRNGAVLVLDEIGDVAVFDDFDIGAFFDSRHEGAFDFGARAIAIGMQDSAAAVSGFSPERQFAIGRAIELSAVFDEFADLFGALGREYIDAIFDR